MPWLSAPSILKGTWAALRSVACAVWLTTTSLQLGTLQPGMLTLPSSHNRRCISPAMGPPLPAFAPAVLYHSSARYYKKETQVAGKRS